MLSLLLHDVICYVLIQLLFNYLIKLLLCCFAFTLVIARRVDTRFVSIARHQVVSPLSHFMYYVMCIIFSVSHTYRVRQKNNPLGKAHYLSDCSWFFHQICSFYRGFKPYTQQILLQYLLCFKNYNWYLNLKVYFSKWTGN